LLENAGAKYFDTFGEECMQEADVHSVASCDVCEINPILVDMTEELRILLDAITVVGSKGEVKIVQWIRGSSLQWMIRQHCLMVTSKGEVRFGGKIYQAVSCDGFYRELKFIIKKSARALCYSRSAACPY